MGVAPGPVKITVAAVIVEGSIASVKVAAKVVLIATPVATLTGIVELTTGAVVSGAVPVEKLHTKLLGRAFPARSFAPIVIVAVKVVPAARLLVGVKVAMLLA
ncbi:MAG: hypothetical protein AMXMBFR20_32850 [Planctomycetia bacterium]